MKTSTNHEHDSLWQLRRSIFLLQSGQNPLRRKRRFMQADSGRIEDRVGDGRADRSARRFAAAESRHLRTVDQNDLDLGNIGKFDNRISSPIQRLNAGRVELYFLKQRTAHALNNISFDLVLEAVRVDDEPTVVREGESLDCDIAARLVHFEFRYRAADRAGPIGKRNVSARGILC